jgi:hypothetical protein
MKLTEIGNPTFIALETFRKSGEAVNTPVWVVEEAGKLYVWTSGDSWKVKRIRNNSRVRVAVSDMRGTPQSDWVEAQAHVFDAPEEEAKQRQRMAAKYGLQFHAITFMNKLRRAKTPHVVIVISNNENKA